jgi:histidinol-phosphate phosphatase family protein
MDIRPPLLVLFDRDGTLIEDVPYNARAELVAPRPTVSHALRLLRERGIRTGVVTNQSGVARGLISPGQLALVNAEVDRRLGPFDAWAVCPHGPADGCDCRKPAPGLVLRATHRLGISPLDTVVIGDIGADMGAARAAGCRGILVPTPATRREEVVDAPAVAPDVLGAVLALLGAGVAT